jgi:hypothetical protein
MSLADMYKGNSTVLKVYSGAEGTQAGIAN